MPTQNNEKQTCPHCGSSNFIGGRFGGKCYDCGYQWGNP